MGPKDSKRSKAIKKLIIFTIFTFVVFYFLNESKIYKAEQENRIAISKIYKAEQENRIAIINSLQEQCYSCKQDWFIFVQEMKKESIMSYFDVDCLDSNCATCIRNIQNYCHKLNEAFCNSDLKCLELIKKQPLCYCWRCDYIQKDLKKNCQKYEKSWFKVEPKKTDDLCKKNCNIISFVYFYQYLISKRFLYNKKAVLKFCDENVCFPLKQRLIEYWDFEIDDLCEKNCNIIRSVYFDQWVKFSENRICKKKVVLKWFEEYGLFVSKKLLRKYWEKKTDTIMRNNENVVRQRYFSYFKKLWRKGVIKEIIGERKRKIKRSELTQVMITEQSKIFSNLNSPKYLKHVYFRKWFLIMMQKKREKLLQSPGSNSIQLTNGKWINIDPENFKKNQWLIENTESYERLWFKSYDFAIFQNALKQENITPYAEKASDVEKEIVSTKEQIEQLIKQRITNADKIKISTKEEKEQLRQKNIEILSQIHELDKKNADLQKERLKKQRSLLWPLENEDKTSSSDKNHEMHLELCANFVNQHSYKNPYSKERKKEDCEGNSIN